MAEPSPFVIVGLGNPGEKYKKTRHNIGFQVLDAFRDQVDASWNEQSAHQSLIYKSQNLLKLGSVFLIQPQTYMNLSGQAVASFMRFFKIPLEQLLVIHDDVDQNFGAMKYQSHRSPGGHNGIKDIHEKLGTPNYARLKLGVNSVENRDTPHFVLGKFTEKENAYFMDTWSKLIQESLLSWMKQGLGKTASKYNRKQGATNCDGDSKS